MDERVALFANVLNDPADDTARLVFADWLEEHDEGDRAGFIRAGVTAARFRDEPLIDDPDYYAAISTMAGVATWGGPARWLSELGVGRVPLTGTDWLWDSTGDRVTVRIGRVSGVFTRGMLSELIVPLAEWYDLAVPALTAWPLECATVTDVPGLRFSIDAPTDERPDWRLSATLTLRPRRRPGMLRRLTNLVATEEHRQRPVAPYQWEAERRFPDRAALAGLIDAVSIVLVEEVRAAADNRWPPPPER